MKCLLARDGTTPSDEKWAIKMEDSKSFRMNMSMCSPFQRQSMIKIYRETSQLWMRQNGNTTNSKDSIETDCVYEAYQIWRATDGPHRVQS